MRVARGGFRRRYFHEDLDLGLDGPQTIQERRNMDAPPTEPARDRRAEKTEEARSKVSAEG